MTGGSGDLAGGPQRVIPGMDTICLSCHAVFEDLDVVAGVGLCLNCHASKYGAPDINSELAKQLTGVRGMGITDIDRDHQSEEGIAANFSAPNNRHAQCYDCHNAQEIFPWEDTPLTGIWGIEITGAEAWNTTPTLQITTQVSSQEELCFKCHSTSSAWNVTLPLSRLYFDANGTTLATENKAFAFNTKNSAYHPVRAQGRNQSNALKWQLEGATSQSVNKLDTTSMIKCTDCHNSDEAGGVQGPASNYTGDAGTGPHGSENTATLRANYMTSVSTTDLPATPMTKAKIAQNFALCFLCHDIDKLLSPDSSGDTTFATNFSKNGTKNLHYWHLLKIGEDPGGGEDPSVGGTPVCRVCHYNLHSNQEAKNTQYRWWNGPPVTLTSRTPINGTKSRLINFAPGTVSKYGSYPAPAWYFRSDPGFRTRRCYLTCHLPNFGGGIGDRNMDGRDYEPTADLDSDAMTYTPSS